MKCETCPSKLVGIDRSSVRNHLSHLEGPTLRLFSWNGPLSGANRRRRPLRMQRELLEPRRLLDSTPIAIADFYTLDEDVVLSVAAETGVLSNDESADNEPLVATLVATPARGEVRLEPSGAFVYTPPENESGTVTFTYTASGLSTSEVQTVTLDIRAIYDPPEATPDEYSVLPGDTLGMPWFVGLLTNDSSADDLPLNAVLDQDVDQGQLTFAANGGFTYDPMGYVGVARFRYHVEDTIGASAPVDVTITINTPPTTSNDVYTANEDTQLVVNTVDAVTANDKDADGQDLSAFVVEPTANGSLEFAADGSFTYFPDADFVGRDSFIYAVTDGMSDPVTATVRIRVNGSNDPPRVIGDGYFALPEALLSIPAERGVLINDVDIDSRSFQIELADDPEFGDLLRFDKDGSFEYQPVADFVGVDSFSYLATDAEGATAQGTVKVFVGEAPIRLSEVVSANNGSIRTITRRTPNHRFSESKIVEPDWFELENLSDESFDLTGFYVTDKANAPTKYRIADGTTIPPHGQLLVLASKLDIRDAQLDQLGSLHTNFSINGNDGEYLALTLPDGRVLDEVDVPPLIGGTSYGRVEDQWKYLEKISPGQPNPAAGLTGIAEPAVASVIGGYYDDPFEVVLKAAENAIIRFTLDGSEPTLEHGQTYQQPLSIDGMTILRMRVYREGYAASEIATQSYLFIDDILRQPIVPEGFPDTWYVSHADYEMDPRVTLNTESPFYQDVRAGLRSLPSLSIVTDVDNLFGAENGIYTHPSHDGLDSERPASMEYITEAGTQQIQLNAGLRLQGGISRSPSRLKHNFRLLFKERHGPSLLDLPELFPNSDVSRYNTFVLRGADTWRAADQWMRAAQDRMGHLALEQAYVHLYLDGVYWGIFHMFEKPTGEHFAQHFGGNAEDYDVVQHGGTPVDGNRDQWDAMISHVRGGLETDEAYQTLQDEFLNVPSFIDYMLINFYGGNRDWDHNNWFAGRRREPGAKWHMLSWDAESTFSDPTVDRTRAIVKLRPTEIYEALRANAEYRILFADHVHRHFFNDGLMTPTAAAALWQEFGDQLRLALAAESARWGDLGSPSHVRSYENSWQSTFNHLKTNWFSVRTEIVVEQFRSLGLYPNVVAPHFSQHGGFIGEDLNLTMSAPAGTIYFTTDGTDPRLPGGNIATGAQTYEQPLSLSGDTRLKARVWIDGTWSALNEASFIAPMIPAENGLRISEIHYHPGPVTDTEIAAGITDPNEFEFIELVNAAAAPIDLANVQLVMVNIESRKQGVAFDFAQSDYTRLAPGERIVVVENENAFRIRYGDATPVAGQWTGKLSNGGEVLRLEAAGREIQQLTYDDGWIPNTDGGGPSLELAIDPASSDLLKWSQAVSWRPSPSAGGTPGTATIGDSNGDGRFDSEDLVHVFQIGEYDDSVTGNSTFADGDWNGDGDFDSEDFVFAFQLGGYQGDAVLGLLAAAVDAVMAHS